MADAKTERIDVENVMATESGRRFVSRLLEYAGTDINVFDADPITHAHNAGKRSVGVWLKNEVKEVNYDQYMRMMKELEHG